MSDYKPEEIADAKTKAWFDYQTDYALWPTKEEREKKYAFFLMGGYHGFAHDNWKKYL